MYNLMMYPKKILYFSMSKFLRIFTEQRRKHATINNTKAIMRGKIIFDSVKTPARFSIA